MRGFPPPIGPALRSSWSRFSPTPTEKIPAPEGGVPTLEWGVGGGHVPHQNRCQRPPPPGLPGSPPGCLLSKVETHKGGERHGKRGAELSLGLDLVPCRLFCFTRWPNSQSPSPNTDVEPQSMAKGMCQRVSDVKELTPDVAFKRAAVRSPSAEVRQRRSSDHHVSTGRALMRCGWGRAGGADGEQPHIHHGSAGS